MPAVDANSSYVFGNTSPEYSSATKTIGSTAFKASSYAPASELEAEAAAAAAKAGSAAQTSDPMPSVDANSSYVFGNTSPEFSASTKTIGSTAFKATSYAPESELKAEAAAATAKAAETAAPVEAPVAAIPELTAAVQMEDPTTDYYDVAEKRPLYIANSQKKDPTTDYYDTVEKRPLYIANA
jgi:hypothetical protein